MYGKAIKETQSNIHTNQRNPMEIDEHTKNTYENKTKSQKGYGINEIQRKPKESLKFKEH